MKQEVLRIQITSCPYAPARTLRHISLAQFAGETTGYVGLTRSGKDHLVRMLTGAEEVPAGAVRLLIDGKNLTTAAARSAAIYRIGPENYRIRAWSVAEYVGLVRSGWLLLGRQENRMRRDISALIGELSLPLADVDRKISELDEFEKRLMDLVRACCLKARVLVVEDELEGFSPDQIRAFGTCLRRAAARLHMTVIISAHSQLVMQELSDHYVFFRDGTICKKCRRSDITGQEQIEQYLLGTESAAKQRLDAATREQASLLPGDPAAVYRLKNFRLRGGSALDLDFRAGSVTTLLLLEESARYRLFLNLSARNMDPETFCIIDGSRIGPGDYRKAAALRVASAMRLGSQDEIFDNMSTAENLLLPSLRKISTGDYIFSSDRLVRGIDRSAILPGDLQTLPEAADINENIAIILERWFLYRPRVLVLYEPFDLCDAYGVSIVRSYLRRFAAQGCACILIKSREEYAEDISDEIIRL